MISGSAGEPGVPSMGARTVGEGGGAIGQRARRHEDSRLLRGLGKFADDVDRVADVMPAVVTKVRQLAGVLGRAAS